MAKKNKTEKSNKPEVSVGFGLGGLFEGIQKLVETAGKLKESGDISKTGEFEIPGLGEKGKGIFGFSVRTLAGDERCAAKSRDGLNTRGPFSPQHSAAIPSRNVARFPHSSVTESVTPGTALVPESVTDCRPG